MVQPTPESLRRVCTQEGPEIVRGLGKVSPMT